ncbi:hypothetical protein EF847_18000 [Actinobacteria bacterium YIM 96077]|uniref:CU044_5270 family protein n=1 Tax=Phytoactinopolyspora halophila TaxID=1981511 RepID=A0A329QTG0_9ACTN|nr:hypothetical protein [Phytoactinopolyspora halophila]AYY14307.1 hypothetical protein EF847_18000 [Actinobacteria bacterium YIM 96077]RAW14849.1 hypothetical protein DPM12_10215 [Phytoactinopolyspora halophila]
MNSTMPRSGTYESPPSVTLPPDREEAIRQLLESAVRETVEAEEAQLHHRRTTTPRRSSPLVRVGIATAVTVLLVALALIVSPALRPDRGIAHAATPELAGHETADGVPASDTLRELADRATATPVEPVTDDSDDEDATRAVHTERWSLALTVDGAAGAAGGEGRAGGESAGGAADAGSADPGNDAVRTAVIPVLRELTEHADGSVSIREVGGEPQFPDEDYRRAWNDEGRPGPHGQVIQDTVLPPGTYQFMYPAELPEDPAELRNVLATERPGVTEHAEELVRAVHDLRNEQELGPDERAGVLDMLADEPGVVELGYTTDRAGREALAFAADGEHSGWPMRHVLLVSPDDGRILAYEGVLTDDVDGVDAETPAVIDYTVFH